MGAATPPVGLALSSRLNDDTMTVIVTGELDIATAGHLRTHVQEILHGGATRVILEMTGVSFIAAAGLSVLVALADSATAYDTMLQLGRVSPTVTRVLEITGLDERFPTNSVAARRSTDLEGHDRGGHRPDSG